MTSMGADDMPWTHDGVRRALFWNHGCTRMDTDERSAWLVQLRVVGAGKDTDGLIGTGLG
jgi:hypothetical protein